MPGVGGSSLSKLVAAQKGVSLFASPSSWPACASLDRQPTGYAHKACCANIPPNVQEIRYVPLCAGFGRTALLRIATDPPATGDIVHLSILGQSTVVIDSYDAAIELLEQRSAHTSDRPRLVMAELSVPLLHTHNTLTPHGDHPPLFPPAPA